MDDKTPLAYHARGMTSDPNYLNGVRDALAAIEQVGGAGVLAALDKLGLSISDLGSPAFLCDMQSRAEDHKRFEDEFRADKADDYPDRRVT